MKKRKYKLRLTKKQAQVVVDALDLYERIGMGQYNEILFHRAVPDHGGVDEARALLSKVHTLLTGLPQSAYFGIMSTNISDKYRVAYDIQQVIRHRLAWDETPEGGMSVAFDEPRPFSKEGLPVITTNVVTHE